MRVLGRLVGRDAGLTVAAVGVLSRVREGERHFGSKRAIRK